MQHLLAEAENSKGGHEYSRQDGRWIFDLAVVVAVLSAVWMGVAGNWDGAFRFAVVAGLMLAARGADVPAPFAAAFAGFLLLATWASVQHWYRQIPQFDVLVHVLPPAAWPPSPTSRWCEPASCLPCGTPHPPCARGRRWCG